MDDAPGSIITTRGADSPGIIAQSVAGHGGEAGNQYSLVSFCATGGSAGYGGPVAVTSAGGVVTNSDDSPAISAQSIGGGGGSGGNGFGLFFAQGDNGGNGGRGGDVSLVSRGH